MSSHEADIGVSVVTYNHAPFIADTLDAILNQETRYSMVVHISDDGSDDGTREIIANYARAHPNTVRAHLNESRMGIRDNFMSSIERCLTKYVAICDGDDLWTDMHKLERQVNILEAHPSLSTCFHSAQVVDRWGTPQVVVPRAKQMHGGDYDLEDLVRFESFFATSSIVFRRPDGPVFPLWFSDLENIVDLPLNMVNASRGPMHHIDEIMCTYRSNSSGHAYSSRDPTRIWFEAIRMFELLERYLDPTYRQQLLDLQRRNWRYIVIEQFLRGDLSDADSTLKGYASWAVERDMDVVDELQKLRRFRMAVQIFPRRVRRRALRLFAPRLSD